MGGDDQPAVMRLRRRTVDQLRASLTAIGLALALSTSFPFVAIVLAADPPIQLAAEPVGEQGSFFHRSLNPGESAELIVNLANYGTTAVTARTFAADVYPIINGGFGARLRGEAASGATTWLDYPSEVLAIEPGQAIRRTFMVTVPVGTEPGEYITSLILENEEPLSSGEGISFNQFLRSAVAVDIFVPGPTEAALELRDARHSFLDGRSVVAVAIDNTGDLRLRPSGSFGITTEAGDQVEARQVTMDSVYAHSSTWLEIVLDRPLAPGRYFANIDVADPERGGATAGARPFEVGEATSGPSGLPQTRSTDTVDLPVVGRVDSGATVALAFGGGVLVCAIVLGVLAVAQRRRGDPRTTD
jgi:hypothetical protein